MPPRSIDDDDPARPLVTHRRGTAVAATAFLTATIDGVTTGGGAGNGSVSVDVSRIPVQWTTSEIATAFPGGKYKSVGPIDRVIVVATVARLLVVLIKGNELLTKYDERGSHPSLPPSAD